MKRFLPIVAVLIILTIGGYFVLSDDNTPSNGAEPKKELKIGEFAKNKSCSRLPWFLYKNGFKKPLIDLSQIKYKGVAFIDVATNRVLHKKTWERFDALGTYAIDDRGNIFLTPNPFISITPATFNLQKAVYKMDSKSGKLSRYMVIDEVKPSARNPYGLISIVFDCDDKSFYISSIDKSDYKGAKGRIYHINLYKKEILDKVSGFDALTLAILKSKNGKFLLAGSARDSGVYAFEFKNGKINSKPFKLFKILNPELRVRKIRVIDENTLYLEAIKFNYSLIAQTDKKQRVAYIAKYNPKIDSWSVEEKK